VARGHKHVLLLVVFIQTLIKEGRGMAWHDIEHHFIPNRSKAQIWMLDTVGPHAPAENQRLSG